jgi:hypothetical protein
MFSSIDPARMELAIFSTIFENFADLPGFAKPGYRLSNALYIGSFTK